MSNSFSDKHAATRKRNAEALSAFGIKASESNGDVMFRTIADGNGPTIFTIGYERRDGEDLIAALLDAGVETLVDVREKATSRKPDFRANPLSRLCEEAGLEYCPMPSLGSTQKMRDGLKESGDFGYFARRFRSHLKTRRQEAVDELAQLVRSECVALLCYERSHEDCHRSIISEILHDKMDACVIAVT